MYVLRVRTKLTLKHAAHGCCTIVFEIMRQPPVFLSLLWAYRVSPVVSPAPLVFRRYGQASVVSDFF